MDDVAILYSKAAVDGSYVWYYYVGGVGNPHDLSSDGALARFTSAYPERFIGTEDTIAIVSRRPWRLVKDLVDKYGIQWPGMTVVYPGVDAETDLLHAFAVQLFACICKAVGDVQDAESVDEVVEQAGGIGEPTAVPEPIAEEPFAVLKNVAIVYKLKTGKCYIFDHLHGDTAGECDENVADEMYKKAYWMSDGRFRVIGNVWDSSFYDRFELFGINKWPGQTIFPPGNDGEKTAYDAFCRHLLYRMHMEMQQPPPRRVDEIGRLVDHHFPLRQPPAPTYAGPARPYRPVVEEKRPYRPVVEERRPYRPVVDEPRPYRPAVVSEPHRPDVRETPSYSGPPVDRRIGMDEMMRVLRYLERLVERMRDDEFDRV